MWRRTRDKCRLCSAREAMRQLLAQQVRLLRFSPDAVFSSCAAFVKDGRWCESSVSRTRRNISQSSRCCSHWHRKLQESGQVRVTRHFEILLASSDSDLAREPLQQLDQQASPSFHSLQFLPVAREYLALLSDKNQQAVQTFVEEHQAEALIRRNVSSVSFGDDVDCHSLLVSFIGQFSDGETQEPPSRASKGEMLCLNVLQSE